jgi:hypothetical protein
VRVLVCGWFSFAGMGTTAGDLLSRDVTVSWLAQAGVPFDVAVVEPFGRGLDWRTANPAAYSHLVFVCGPFGNGPPLSELLKRFSNCRLIGLNLSLLQPLEEWNPFEVLFERDSTRCARPDLSLLHQNVARKVAGLILAHPQNEYEDRGCHAAAHAALLKVLEDEQILTIPIDTCLENNLGGLRQPAQIEALLARMDLVATTRLHGLVLALKNGVPALAIDPIRGGAKISYQANILAWPAVVGIDELSEGRLADLCAYCLTAEARVRARECALRAVQMLAPLQGDFVAALKAQPL